MNFRLYLLFLLFFAPIYTQATSTIEYYRHLRYNHVSPYLSIVGIHPINQETAESTSHYVFKYDSSGRLIEVLNNHYHTEKRHPLASLGVYKLVIEYKENQEIRTFYNPNGARISNDRAVYKEVYTYDEHQFKSALHFYDLEDNLIESNWGIASYQWGQKEDLIIERRFNLKKEAINLSPYFNFGITGILLDKNGLPKAHYNLNEQLEVINNEAGIAAYKDSFDEQGNHIKYSYYDADEKLTFNQWQFAVGKKSYDELGNHILLEYFDPEGKAIRKRPIYSNASIELSEVASAQDSLEIRQKSLGYLKALQQLDPILMDEVMSDSLNKVTIAYDRHTKEEFAKPTTRDQMIAFAEDWNKSNMKFPPVPNNQVTILGIYNRIASVELLSDNWVEYLHLIKLDGKWEIINLIWQHKDVARYPKAK